MHTGGIVEGAIVNIVARAVSRSNACTVHQRSFPFPWRHCHYHYFTISVSQYLISLSLSITPHTHTHTEVVMMRSDDDSLGALAAQPGHHVTTVEAARCVLHLQCGAHSQLHWAEVPLRRRCDRVSGESNRASE